MFPHASGIGNVCYPASGAVHSPFPEYFEGCNLWLRTNPTYPIFIPLMVIGLSFLILELRDSRPASLEKAV